MRRDGSQGNRPSEQRKKLATRYGVAFNGLHSGSPPGPSSQALPRAFCLTRDNTAIGEDEPAGPDTEEQHGGRYPARGDRPKRQHGGRGVVPESRPGKG